MNDSLHRPFLGRSDFSGRLASLNAFDPVAIGATQGLIASWHVRKETQFPLHEIPLFPAGKAFRARGGKLGFVKGEEAHSSIYS